eukprot:1160226-Pelagomonas_calceolata.AAC.4
MVRNASTHKFTQTCALELQHRASGRVRKFGKGEKDAKRCNESKVEFRGRTQDCFGSSWRAMP